MSDYYYRLDGRGDSILNRCPKTLEEYLAIKNPKERCRWTKVANPDNQMIAYKMFKKKLMKEKRVKV